MAYTVITGGSPGTRIVDSVTTTVGQVVCNRDGTDIGTGGTGFNVTIVGPLGQQLAAASIPIVLTAAQISALTPPANTGYSTSAKQDTQITAEQAIQAAVGPVTQNSFAVAASGTRNIPTGAKGWTVTILTGTATINGVASLPAGFSDYSEKALVAGFDVVCASSSTAYVRYGS